MKKQIFLSLFLLLFFLQGAFSQESIEEWKYYKSANVQNQIDTKQRLSGIALVPITEKNVSYVIGENAQTFTKRVSVKPFMMNKFETTYDLWCRVLKDAVLRGYEFENPGQEGSMGRRGKSPTENGKFQPVVTISWRDAVVWCNALSEIEGLNPCYKYEGEVVKDASDSAKIDLIECDLSCNGYRLPQEAEWEYAARKTASGKLSRGDIPSGSAKNVSGDYDGFSDFAEEANVNSNGTNEVATSCPKNDCGLYDMAGNVLEFCNDWYAEYFDGVQSSFGTSRVCRGGSWSIYTPMYASGDRYAYDPSEAYNYMGFRICQSIIE